MNDAVASIRMGSDGGMRFVPASPPRQLHPAQAAAESRPKRLPTPDAITAERAAKIAVERFPGPAGTLLAAEIRGYSVGGLMAHPMSAVVRLIAELTQPDLPPAA